MTSVHPWNSSSVRMMRVAFLALTLMGSGCGGAVASVRPPLALPPPTRPPLTVPVPDEWLQWLQHLVGAYEQNCRVLAVMRQESPTQCTVP